MVVFVVEQELGTSGYESKVGIVHICFWRAGLVRLSWASTRDAGGRCDVLVTHRPFWEDEVR